MVELLVIIFVLGAVLSGLISALGKGLKAPIALVIAVAALTIAGGLVNTILKANVC